MKKWVYFVFILLILSMETSNADSFYQNGILVELTQKRNIDEKKISYKQNDVQVFITNKIILKTKGESSAQHFEKKYHLKFLKSYRNVYIFKVDDIAQVVPICKTIFENENVVYAQPSFLRKIKHQALVKYSSNTIDKSLKYKLQLQAYQDTKSMLDNDNSVNYYKYYDDVFRYKDESFWYLYNNGTWSTTAGYENNTYTIQSVNDVDTNVLEVIDENITGKGVKVLVVDSSFELTHPDLHFSNTYNFNLQNKDITPSSTADFHGTAVAGIIGANRGNNYGIMGVAPDSYLIAFNGLFDIEDDDLYLESYIDTFYKALELNVAIINCSWTSTSILDEASKDAIETFIKEARSGKGGFVVFSAGNENATSLINEPSLQDVISVGSIEADGTRSIYSNYGKKLDLVAPSNFVSLDLTGENGFSAAEMGFVAGTSFSAPIVSGIIALMLEVEPNITLDKALDVIYGTAKKIGDYNYEYNIDDDNRYNIFYTKSLETGYGLIDAKAIIEKLKSDQNTTLENDVQSTFLDTLAVGWNFVGTQNAIDDFSAFDNVAIVWIYENGDWKGYSPNTVYAKELRKQNKLLTQIKRNSGMWIYKDEE